MTSAKASEKMSSLDKPPSIGAPERPVDGSADGSADGSKGPTCLVIKNDGLGDLILASGLLSELAQHFPGGVDLVTCGNNRQIAEAVPGLRQVFYVSRTRLRFLPVLDRLGLFVPASRQLGDLGVLQRLRAHRYDVAICLRRFIRTSTLVLMRWCRAEVKHCAWQFPSDLPRSVAQRASRGWQHWQPRDKASEPLSEILYYQHFLHQTLGLELLQPPRLQLPSLAKPPLSTKPSPSAKLARVDDLEPGHPDGERTLGLCIGGASMGWPTASWIALVDRLIEGGWAPHLFGGADAQSAEQAIVAAHPSCRSFVGRLGFMESVPRLRTCEAFIGNDTGFTHFAALVVPKCLVLLGGGTFGRFFPWPAGHTQWAVYHGLDCFDCDWKCRFAQRHCLDRLSPEAVFRTFQGMLTEPSPGPHWINTHAEDVTYDVAWRYPGWGGGRRRISDGETSRPPSESAETRTTPPAR